MPECDGFFDERGIGFTDQFEDAAVRAVLSADFYDPVEKKQLILCWYDTAYGQWTGLRFDLNDSRARMSNYIKNSPHRTFEALIDGFDPAP